MAVDKKIKKSSSKKIKSKPNLNDISKFTNINIVKNGVYMLLVINLIVIIYVSSIINYLNNLKMCKCFQDKNNENFSSINYLIIIESIILTINIILFLFNLMIISTLNKAKYGGGNNNNIATYISLAIMLLIYGYFIYYVYKLYQNIDENCECSKSWIRYLLYIQAIILLIQIIITISSLFL
jgi:hypothetical protein